MRAEIEAVLRTVRQIAGMPDYQAYIEHAERCHPGQRVLTEREFYERHLESRYGDGATRCC
jgi:uncharacterized short protein YbdD (DUF466 family)